MSYIGLDHLWYSLQVSWLLGFLSSKTFAKCHRFILNLWKSAYINKSVFPGLPVKKNIILMQNDKRVEIAEAEDKTNYPLYEEIKWHKLSFTKVFLHIFGCAITFVADIYIPHTTIKSFFFKYLAEKIPFVNKRFVVYLHILNDVALPSSLCSMIHFSCLKLYWDLWSLFM